MLMNHSRTHFSVAPGVYFFLALLILLIPLRWLLGAVVSITVHEFCHILAIRSFGVPIRSVQVGISGARIQTHDMSLWQELICALAGPMGGILLLLTAKWFPVTALCAGFHTLYNLLPVYPLDGGRILRCICRLLWPAHAAIICKTVTFLTVAAFLSLCMFLFLRTAEPLFLFIAFYFLLQTCRSIKYPCKERRY